MNPNLRGSVGKNPPAMQETACNARGPGLTSGLRTSPGGGATQSSILAWEIPWTEKPGRLQPMGSQIAGYHLSTKPPPYHEP